MIRKFPIPIRQPAPLPLAELMVHAPGACVDEDRGLPWVRWLFQSVRARCVPMLFQTAAAERVGAIADWQSFTREVFLPVLAPAMLRAWKAARDGADAVLIESDRSLASSIADEAVERSLSAGAILLNQTRAAKHQAALGRFRMRFDEGATPGHAVVVWSAVAALFQLPPLDLFAEYLHEEWLAATQDVPQATEPQGPLSFPALAAKALHAAGVHVEFSVQDGPVEPEVSQ